MELLRSNEGVAAHGCGYYIEEDQVEDIRCQPGLFCMIVNTFRPLYLTCTVLPYISRFTRCTDFDIRQHSQLCKPLPLKSTNTGSDLSPSCQRLLHNTKFPAACRRPAE